MKREIWKGSEAIAEAAIRAGCRGFFGYPITPQNEIPEYMSLRMPQVGGVFVQAESEVAAINMVYGAAGSGIRAMTSSSSPGISLKQEGISYMAGAQLPAVIVNVMRGGPGLGSIQPSQADYFQATRGGGNGDYRTPVLAPSNLQEAVDRKEFREDLLYRINTIQVEIPPLRQRPEDIPSLAEFFLQKYSSKYHKESLRLAPDAVRTLQAYPWPGNIRELQHAIEKAVILSEGDRLQAGDFYLRKSGASPTLADKMTLEQAEKLLIQHALRRNKDNLSAVAAELGITRPTLYNKIRKYQL